MSPRYATTSTVWSPTYSRGRWTPSPVLTTDVALPEVAEAYRAMDRWETIKAAVRP